MRLGLCCTFVDGPVRFRHTTARYAGTLAPAARRAFLAEIAEHNARALGDAVRWCGAHGIGAFRIMSQLLPLATHPEHGYRLDRLDRGGAVREALARAGRVARARGVRLSFHPDQFVVPGSLNPAAARASLAELEMLAEVAAHLGAEQLTLHGGGAAGGKPAALERLRRGLDRLSPRARARVALENDDRVYTVADLLPTCRELGVPLVYDVHHHRCNPDGLGVDEATALAADTWGRREPWAHVSSPRGGWTAADPRHHADFIAAADVPRAWIGRRMTVDVEAKAKEKAVLRLARWLSAPARPARPAGGADRSAWPRGSGTRRAGRARDPRPARRR
jgi:UV DNA damage endonuclease